jgi:hypothetical protein
MSTAPGHRISVDPEYTCALGYAIYCFSSLEWNVAWIIERLDPGYSGRFSGRQPANSGKI